MQDKKRVLSSAFGKVVKKLHGESKLSARAIAYGMNMSKTTILLAGQGKLDPQLSTFCKIAEAFYIKPDELMSLVIKELPENWFVNE